MFAAGWFIVGAFYVTFIDLISLQSPTLALRNISSGLDWTSHVQLSSFGTLLTKTEADSFGQCFHGSTRSYHRDGLNFSG
jgi:hypothetical protein